MEGCLQTQYLASLLDQNVPKKFQSKINIEAKERDVVLIKGGHQTVNR